MLGLWGTYTEHLYKEVRAIIAALGVLDNLARINLNLHFDDLLESPELSKMMQVFHTGLRSIKLLLPNVPVKLDMSIWRCSSSAEEAIMPFVLDLFANSIVNSLRLCTLENTSLRQTRAQIGLFMHQVGSRLLHLDIFGSGYLDHITSGIRLPLIETIELSSEDDFPSRSEGARRWASRVLCMLDACGPNLHTATLHVMFQDRLTRRMGAGTSLDCDGLQSRRVSHLKLSDDALHLFGAKVSMCSPTRLSVCAKTAEA